MKRLFVTLYGTEPVPQGSKTAFVNKATGRAIVTDANKNTGPWREAVAAQAVRAMETQGWLKVPAGQPVGIEVQFFFNRPQSHYRTGKWAGALKDTAPVYKPTKPDVDKLERALCDALTGVVFHDDAQVSRILSTKVYSEQAGIHCVVYTL